MNVKVGCLCLPDGKRHPDGDTIKLLDTLDFRQTTAARRAIAWLPDDSTNADIEAMLAEWYLLHCIESWTVKDAKGKALPQSRQNVIARLLSDDAAATAVAEEADRLYSGKILLPLVKRALASSQPTPTLSTDDEASISRPNGSGQKHPKPSRRSSTSTSPTGVIATTAN